MIKTSFIYYLNFALKTRIAKSDTIMGYGKNGICQGDLPTGCNQR
jgi:hypothetical protein